MAAGLLICLLAACNNEPLDPTGGPNDNYLEISFSRTTRADLDGNGAGNFSEGDRVGLYIDNGSETRYRELTYTSGEWQPRLRRSEFGEGELTLAAHYPVLPETAADPTHAAFTLADNQSAEGFAASDLLFARQSIPADSYRATMTFTHALHRLRVEIQGEGVSTPNLRSRMSGTVDLLTGTVSVAEDSFGWITPRKNADGTYEAVIFPQSTEAYRGDEGLLTFKTADRDVVYQAPDLLDGSDFNEFQPGKQVTLRLNLKSSGDLKWANRKVWFSGIQAPEESAWKQYFLNTGYEYYCLPWKAEYGWYDCKKVTPTGGEPDGMMCWAASASNMLHWWIDRNKSYIDRYGDRYTGPDYTYPHEEKAQESDIFAHFADAFANEAGFIDAGLNWFLHGTTDRLPPRDKLYDGGYFKEVFPDGVRLATAVNGLSRERFNETIKDAFLQNKAVGLTEGLKTTSSHAVTIWGAEFDENGDVSAIYLVDNNDRGNFEAYGIGCRRYDIYYDTYPGTTATCTCYRYKYNGNWSSLRTIYQLFLLSLGQEYWEQYFAAQGQPAVAQ